jgi:hypothetical protein
LVLVTSMRRCIFFVFILWIWVCKLFFGVFVFLFFIGFLFFILYLLWWLVTILLKGRTRARFGSSHYYAQLFFIFILLLLLFLLLLCSCAPAAASCLDVVVRRPASSSCCVLQNVLVLDFNKLHTIIGLWGYMLGVHLPFFWVEYGLQICAMCDIWYD